jgi:23S rRNA (guanosine2251-2'-O)-methyltransferase
VLAGSAAGVQLADGQQLSPASKGGSRGAPKRGSSSRTPREAPGGGSGSSRRAGPKERFNEGRPNRDRRRQIDKRELGGDQVEGRQAVLELLNARRREVKQVWIVDGLDPTPELDKISSLASRSGARVMAVPFRRIDLEARTRSHQGVLAKAAPLTETPLDDLATATKGVKPFLLVLDGVTDPQNVGALLRIAECAGITGVVLGRHNAAHITPTVAKVAAGAVEYLRFAIAPGIPTAISNLSEAGVICIGLDPEATTDIYEIKVGDDATPNGIALVLGDEGKGLASLTRRRCSQLVSIPQQGKIASLNVAAAGAVACFELAKKIARKA